MKTPLHSLSKPAKQIYSLHVEIILPNTTTATPSPSFPPACEWYKKRMKYVGVHDKSERGGDSQSGATTMHFPSGSSQFIRGGMLLAFR